MKTSTLTESLESKIEQLVLSEVALIRAAAVAAVERALASPGVPVAMHRAARAPSQSLSRLRRSRAEVTALSERLAAAVQASPGASMSELSAKLGVPGRELSLPATQLKKSGRIRSAGQRQYTKYFPGVALSS